MKSQTPKCAEGVFQIQSPVCSVNFSPLPPFLHDLIISPHVKHPPINFPKKICSAMQSFYTKKVPPYFVGGEETLSFIFVSFCISKSFIANFCGTDQNFSIKTT